MKLVRITHLRCDEPDCYTFAWAPDEWSHLETQRAINRARDAYLAALEFAKGQENAPNEWRYGPIPYERYPDLTVAQAKAEWDAKKDAYKAWEEECRRTRQRFEKFLTDEGFTSVWKHNDGLFEVNWGHRHGSRLEYGDDELDTLPSPAKVAGGEDYDEDGSKLSSEVVTGRPRRRRGEP